MQAYFTRWPLFVGLVITVFLFGQQFSSRVTAEDLDDLLVDGGVIPGDPISLRISLRSALTGTRFEDHWDINSPHGTSSLGIFVIDSSDTRLATHRHIAIFRHNAVFLKRLSAIVVDYQFVGTLANKYFASDSDMGLRATLLSWIIGHEIGHVIRGHPTSHFRSNDMLARRRRGLASEYREDEADAYFADTIRAAGPDAVTPYALVLIRITEFESALGATQHATGDYVHSHPTYLLGPSVYSRVSWRHMRNLR